MPEPPQPQAKSTVKNRERLVCEGGTGAQASGLAHAQGRVSNQLGQDQAAHPPGFRGDSQDVPSGSHGPRGHREHFSDDDFLEDEDDDDMNDRNSFAEAPVDRAFAHLIDHIYHRFPHSEPQTVASSAARCDYESFFAVAELPEPSRKLLRLYPQVAEIQSTVGVHAANLGQESRPLFRMLPFCRRAFSIGDEPDFCKQRYLNSDFSSICRSKSVPKTRMASVSL